LGCPGGNGGGSDIEYAYEVNAQKQWDIYVNPGGWYKIVSTEEFIGLKGTVSNALPCGAKFVSPGIVHKNDYIINNSSLVYEWSNSAATVTMLNETQVRSTVSGLVTNPPSIGGDFNFSPKHKLWGVLEIPF